MAEPEDLDEDLFADLYEADDEPTAPAAVPVQDAPLASTESAPVSAPTTSVDTSALPADPDDIPATNGADHYGDHSWQGEGGIPQDVPEQEHSGIMVKEDGKMFIGGLNWETTDEGLRDYFTQFGEVQECTVMRDSATGRSRGFGFLTFKDAKTVNIVMVKEHFLDGKLIDPKRAIPRDEQEKTSKIFVGGVSQDATEEDFEQFFAQFGRVIDATLMMDKDTGRPRGFGFVTFDSEAAVDACLRTDLRILGKPVEVKKAQPRGDMRAEEEAKGRRGGRGGGGFHDQGGNQGVQGQVPQGGMPNGMSPSMMVQYWQKMQQFMAMMRAQQAMGGMMGGMNPMMQQMQMANMQQMQQQMQGMQDKDGQGMQGMNPQMMQQMMQMQQQQQQGAGQGGGESGFNNQQMQGVPTGPSGNGRRTQQQQNFNPRDNGMGGFNGDATSWEGMYDDVPQPNMPPSGPRGGGQQGGFARGGHKQAPAGPSNAPAGAPTGPRNANVPGANYRGGGRGGRGRGGFHPYRR